MKEKSIILITHKLDEIQCCFRPRNGYSPGKSIETVEIGGANNQDLAEMMVGRSVSFKTEKVLLNRKKWSCRSKTWL